MWNGNLNIFVTSCKSNSALLHFDLKSEMRHSDTSLRNANFWNESDWQYLVYSWNKPQVLIKVLKRTDADLHYQRKTEKKLWKWNVTIFVKRSKQNANHYSITSKM